LEQEDAVHETGTLFICTPPTPPLGHPEKGRKGLDLWFATFHFSAVILRMNSLFQASENSKCL